MTDEPFVLERTENPHPKMLAGALKARDDAASVEFDEHAPATSYWRGYLTAMADATGCEPDELEAWMDRVG